eukprot:SAG11_NODE_1024_length_6148_cov_7.090263_8_plen_65_part_00
MLYILHVYLFATCMSIRSAKRQSKKADRGVEPEVRLEREVQVELVREVYAIPRVCLARAMMHCL